MKWTECMCCCFPDSVTYEWSGRDGRGGTVTFQYPPDKLPDTKDDILTFGFITPSLDAVLFRVDSRGGESHNDYLQMEIVSPFLKIFLIYSVLTPKVDTKSCSSETAGSEDLRFLGHHIDIK